MNFVRDSTTMSAPCAMGLSRIGVATVLSTTSGRPWRCATSASAARSGMLPAGLPTLSQKTARVPASIIRSTSEAESEAAKRPAIPMRGSVWASSVWVVP